MIVSYQNGNPVRLDDLGTVIDSYTQDKSKFYTNGKLGMVLAVKKQPGVKHRCDGGRH